MAVHGQGAFDFGPLEKEIGKEGTHMIARMFLEDTKDMITQFQEAVQEQNAERVRSLAHMLKGGCRSIVALTSEEFLEVLEDSAARADWAAIRIGVNALGPMYESLRKSILVYLETNGDS